MRSELLDRAVAWLRENADSRHVPCKICEEDTEWFDLVDFNKSCDYTLYPRGLVGVPIVYRICLSCRFIFTDFFDRFSDNDWRRYIYNDDYATLDPEYLDIRPRRNASELAALLMGKRTKIVGLDYGGGNGQTAALLRMKGWTYDTYDPFGQTVMPPERLGKYNFCSAFEVFEHSPDPVQSLHDILSMTSTERLMVLIGTATHDSAVSLQTRLAWWYAAPRNGHVSLYSRKSLRILGSRCGLNYAAVSTGTHLLTRGVSTAEARWMLFRGKVLHRMRAGVLRG